MHRGKNKRNERVSFSFADGLPKRSLRVIRYVAHAGGPGLCSHQSLSIYHQASTIDQFNQESPKTSRDDHDQNPIDKDPSKTIRCDLDPHANRSQPSSLPTPPNTLAHPPHPPAHPRRAASNAIRNLRQRPNRIVVAVIAAVVRPVLDVDVLLLQYRGTSGRAGLSGIHHPHPSTGSTLAVVGPCSVPRASSWDRARHRVGGGFSGVWALVGRAQRAKRH